MKNDLLLFEDGEIKTILVEFVEAGKEISKKEPVFGFHHQFYVPGWIGLVQESIVNKKMFEWESQNFYKDKNYTDFAMWIIESSEKIGKLHMSNRPDLLNVEAMTLFEKQSEMIIQITLLLIEAWRAASPEVSTALNRRVDSDVRMSLYGVVRNDVSLNLKDIGFPQVSVGSNEKGCLEGLKEISYRILGMFVNVMTLAAIAGLISLFFE